MYLDKVKSRTLELGRVARGGFVPCTENEIESLEKKLGYSLPLAYKEFLLWGGKKAGRIFFGQNYSFRDILDNQECAIEQLETFHFTVTEVLPEDSFVFLVHQGYIFLFFRISEGDDPPVYEFKINGDKLRDGDEALYFYTCNESFSEFLLNFIEERAIEEKKARNRR